MDDNIENRVCNNASQTCLKLHTVLSLYKDLQRNTNQDEHLLLLASLRDVKTFLAHQEMQKNENQKLEGMVDSLSSHIGIVALKCLVRDVQTIKDDLEILKNGTGEHMNERRRSVLKEDVELSVEDNQCFDRITQRRHELLTEVEIPKRNKRLRFQPTCVSRELPPKPVSSQQAVDRLLTKRVEKLENFLHEKQARLRAMRKSRVATLAAVRDVDCSLHNTESAIERSKIARRGTQKELVEKSTSHQAIDSRVKPRSLQVCGECQKELKAKDMFWGLEVDSEDESCEEHAIVKRRFNNNEVSQLNESEVTELFDTLSIENDTQDAQRASPLQIQDPKTRRAYIIQQKPAGHAGRGTWATAPYSPLWTVTEIDQSRDHRVEDVEVKKPRISRMRSWLSKMAD